MGHMLIKSPQVSTPVDLTIWASHFRYTGSPSCDITFTNNFSLFGDHTRLAWMKLDNIDENIPMFDHVYSAGEYVYKYDVISVISGNAATQILLEGSTGGEGVWTTVGSSGISIIDTVQDGTVQNFIIDLTIADDDGGGGPVGGTEVVRRYNVSAYRGTTSDYLLRDLFTGTNGTNLTAHTMDNGGLSWVADSGTINITSNRAVASGTGDNRYVASTGNANVCLIMEVRVNQANCGVIFRGSDASNYWMFKLSAANTSDPLIELIEVIAGSPTVRDSYTFTGKGQFSSSGDSYFRVLLDGDDIYCDFLYAINKADGVASRLHYNSSNLNTATRHGIYLPTATPTVDAFYVTTKEIGVLT